MRINLIWLSDVQWRQIEPHLPTDVRGEDRLGHRRVIIGILHDQKSGCRWCDCPPEYGPITRALPGDRASLLDILAILMSASIIYVTKGAL